MSKRMRSVIRNFEELKAQDTASALQIVASGVSHVQHASDVAESTAADGRTSSKILAKSLETHIVVSPVDGAASPSGAKCVYVLVCIDKMHNGAAAPNITDVYSLATSQLYPLRNLDTSSRFQVLMFKCLYLQETVAVSDSTGAGPATFVRYYQKVIVNYYKKWKSGLLIEYKPSSSSGAGTSIEQNAIFVMVTNHAATTLSTADIYSSINTRLRYYD